VSGTRSEGEERLCTGCMPNSATLSCIGVKGVLNSRASRMCTHSVFRLILTSLVDVEQSLGVLGDVAVESSTQATVRGDGHSHGTWGVHSCRQHRGGMGADEEGGGHNGISMVNQKQVGMSSDRQVRGAGTKHPAASTYPSTCPTSYQHTRRYTAGAANVATYTPVYIPALPNKQPYMYAWGPVYVGVSRDSHVVMTVENHPHINTTSSMDTLRYTAGAANTATYKPAYPRPCLQTHHAAACMFTPPAWL
jgi:hypothetical protein